MDPLTEIRHGPRVRKIPLIERQFINQAHIRRQLEQYSGVERKSRHGTWSVSSPSMTCASLRRLRNDLKQPDVGQKELSFFIGLINEPGDRFDSHFSG